MCLFLLIMFPAALVSETSAGHESSLPAVILWLTITLVWLPNWVGNFAVKKPKLASIRSLTAKPKLGSKHPFCVAAGVPEIFVSRLRRS